MKYRSASLSFSIFATCKEIDMQNIVRCFHQTDWTEKFGLKMRTKNGTYGERCTKLSSSFLRGLVYARFDIVFEKNAV